MQIKYSHTAIQKLMNKAIEIAFFLITLPFYTQNNMEHYTYDQEILDENNLRHGTLVATSYLFEGLAYKHVYQHGLLLQTTDFRYQVNHQKELIGNFKNNLPYEGYFVFENEFEIPEISYYEKGEIHTIYRTTLSDILEIELTGKMPVWVACSFKEGVLFDGLCHEQFKLDDGHLLVTEFFKNGERTHVSFWLLAMHYAETIRLNFLTNGYEIIKERIEAEDIDPEIDTREQRLKIVFNEQGSGNLSFEKEKEVIAQYEFKEYELSRKISAIPSIVNYVLNASQTIRCFQKYNFKSVTSNSEKDFYNPSLMNSIYSNLLYNRIPKFSTTEKNEYTTLFQEQHDLESGLLLFLNQEGKPKHGLLLEQENEVYQYSKFKEGTKTEHKEQLTLKNLKQLFFQEEQ